MLNKRPKKVVVAKPCFDATKLHERWITVFTDIAGNMAIDASSNEVYHLLLGEHVNAIHELLEELYWISNFSQVTAVAALYRELVKTVNQKLININIELVVDKYLGDTYATLTIGLTDTMHYLAYMSTIHPEKAMDVCLPMSHALNFKLKSKRNSVKDTTVDSIAGAGNVIFQCITEASDCDWNDENVMLKYFRNIDLICRHIVINNMVADQLGHYLAAMQLCHNVNFKADAYVCDYDRFIIDVHLLNPVLLKKRHAFTIPEYTGISDQHAALISDFYKSLISGKPKESPEK